MDLDTVFNYCDPEVAFFSSTEKKWANRILKLKEQHPEEVTIIKLPEENDGVIYCKLPTSWLRIMPKRKVEMTDEKRAELRDRMKKLRSQ